MLIKSVLITTGLMAVILFCCSCGDGLKNSGGNSVQTNDSQGKFPDVMVGIWEAERTPTSKWGIKFEPDGSISKIIHSLAGPIKVAEGGVNSEGPEESYYVFVLGPCDAKYDEQKKTLDVRIFVKDFFMKLPQGDLQGRSEDYFSGPISKDGKTWKAKWRSYGWLEGGDPPPKDLIDANPSELVFYKLDPKKLKAEYILIPVENSRSAAAK